MHHTSRYSEYVSVFAPSQTLHKNTCVYVYIFKGTDRDADPLRKRIDTYSTRRDPLETELSGFVGSSCSPAAHSAVMVVCCCHYYGPWG